MRSANVRKPPREGVAVRTLGPPDRLGRTGRKQDTCIEDWREAQSRSAIRWPRQANSAERCDRWPSARNCAIRATGHIQRAAWHGCPSKTKPTSRGLIGEEPLDWAPWCNLREKRGQGGFACLLRFVFALCQPTCGRSDARMGLAQGGAQHEHGPRQWRRCGSAADTGLDVRRAELHQGPAKRLAFGAVCGLKDVNGLLVQFRRLRVTANAPQCACIVAQHNGSRRWQGSLHSSFGHLNMDGQRLRKETPGLLYISLLDTSLGSQVPACGHGGLMPWECLLHRQSSLRVLVSIRGPTTE
mmetsp:Transcript_138183/g.359002  ORF Transcript_138183/g.359002 Transcript_138183/m.359002 type:complete len:299 (-) Transcript_138183:606-1502(-)